MEIKLLYESETVKVKAVYYHGELLYTKTIVLDADGYFDHAVTVFSNGDYEIK